tara:strand:- start:2022 stop:2321 length:300 start_codon:yes stop_codon:yes gene_type:complete
MKITKTQLKQIIKEELEDLNEAETPDMSAEQAKSTAIALLKYPTIKAFKSLMELISRSGGKREKIAYAIAHNIADNQKKSVIDTWLKAMRIASPGWFSK